MERQSADLSSASRPCRLIMILDGVLEEGDALPSVRNVAAEYQVDPLTVLKAYQGLVDEELVEKRRGLGMFVKEGARKPLLKGERQKFLSEYWPRVARNHSSRIESKGTARGAAARSSNSERRVAKAMATIEARGLRKTFGTTIALDGIDLRVEEGRILGLIGPNGAGKTTALNAILGLAPYQGELKVLGRDPWNERNRLMRDVSFIADVAVLPRWIALRSCSTTSRMCIRDSIARRRRVSWRRPRSNARAR